MCATARGNPPALAVRRTSRVPALPPVRRPSRELWADADVHADQAVPGADRGLPGAGVQPGGVSGADCGGALTDPIQSPERPEAGGGGAASPRAGSAYAGAPFATKGGEISMTTQSDPMWDIAYQAAVQAYDHPGDRTPTVAATFALRAMDLPPETVDSVLAMLARAGRSLTT